MRETKKLITARKQMLETKAFVNNNLYRNICIFQTMHFLYMQLFKTI